MNRTRIGFLNGKWWIWHARGVAGPYDDFITAKTASRLYR